MYEMNNLIILFGVANNLRNECVQLQSMEMSALTVLHQLLVWNWFLYLIQSGNTVAYISHY